MKNNCDLYNIILYLKSAVGRDDPELIFWLSDFMQTFNNSEYLFNFLIYIIQHLSLTIKLKQGKYFFRQAIG